MIQSVRSMIVNLVQAEEIFKEYQHKLKQKENINSGLKEEISRRKLVEAKVQSYVTTLLHQNSKLKETLEWVTQQTSLDQQIKSKCHETLEAVDCESDRDEEDEDSATDL